VEEHLVRQAEVPSEAADTRLDRFLAGWLGASRAEVRRLLARGGVSVDGKPRGTGDKGAPLRAGETLRVEGYRAPPDRRVASEPEAPLVVLAEGRGWLGVDKPARQPVHPLEEGETGTLLGAVVARYPHVHGVGEGGLRSGVVHRLDVDTSGALLFATQEAAWHALRDAFSRHEVDKRYRAIVLGRFERAREVELGLTVARHHPAFVRVVDPARAVNAGQIRLARQRVRPLEVLRDSTLVEVELETGFLHQVRATLAHLGHPVAGDATYGPGGERDATRAGRQMLHASSIDWRDIRVESPDPPDFLATLAAQRAPESNSRLLSRD
jgi:23S rRNA pseudouridine1911/1915/1917 synthase